MKIKKIKIENKEIKKMLKGEKNEEMVKFLKEELKKNLKKIKKKNKKKEKIILEIKSGVGGGESILFISDLKKMYEKYIEKMKWKKKILSKGKNENKKIVIIIRGENIYKNLKYESGVHRVQRLPKTENRGRIHTSTCRVAVYKNKKLKKKKFKKSDFKIETCKASGAGGQHVNKTDSAVRIKYIPTNTVIECQKERSQHKNKKYALKNIKTKIILEEKIKKENILKNKKKNLLGTGKRAEKIRTYNYKNNRITDHRFKITLNNLNEIMNGNLKKLIKKIKKIKY